MEFVACTTRESVLLIEIGGGLQKESQYKLEFNEINTYGHVPLMPMTRLADKPSGLASWT